MYRLVKSCDDVNFATSTIWNKKLTEGQFLEDSGRKPGYQFVSEASDLSRIKDGTYDFVLSSHVLEHLANPIKALLEWKRVLKERGILLLVVPHKQGTFDDRRQVTGLPHLISDYEKSTPESDLSALPSVLRYHNLALDPAGTRVSLPKLFANNIKYRAMHHHVFVTSSVIQIADYVNLKVLFVGTFLPYHIVVVGQKTDDQYAVHRSNLSLLAKGASWRRLSPFRIDCIV